jgi:peptide/nickel transport system substrate-binding protein
VYSAPELGFGNVPPSHAMEEVTAPDPRTLQVRWRLPYAGADTLSARDRELPPLPRRILRDAFEGQSAEAFAAHPFWTREYVGVGPYRLEQWEPGTFIDAVAFDGYALGRPKIERIKLRFVSDPNTALANLLAGEAHMATDNSIAQVVEGLKGEWAQRFGGRLIHWPNAWRHTFAQHRPELANPRAVLDVRVRKALAHAIDKESINEAVYAGDVIFSDTMIWTKSEWGPAADRIQTRYPYDLRRSEQLMAEAGFQKGTDGISVHPVEGRFAATVRTTAASDFEAEMLIMVDTWRRAGFDIQGSVLPAAQAQDSQVRATYPALFSSNTNLGESALLNYVSSVIPGPENRWNGGNRGGWRNPEYDRLAEEFNRTLDRAQRVDQVTQMLQIYSDELPAISLFFRAQPLAHIPALRGPEVAAPESSMVWNVHEWEFR